MDAESYDRYTAWFHDYFENIDLYDASDVEDFIHETNPNLGEKYVRELVKDYESFSESVREERLEQELEERRIPEGIEGLPKEVGKEIAGEVEIVEKEHRGIWTRVKNFLGRLFG
ncbi:MAG: hypothetical protein ACFFDH_09485 [Promethearchaeota archaeon]